MQYNYISVGFHLLIICSRLLVFASTSFFGSTIKCRDLLTPSFAGVTNAWCSSIPKCQCEEVQPRNFTKTSGKCSAWDLYKTFKKKLKTLIHCNKQYISQYHFLIKECQYYTQASKIPVRLSYIKSINKQREEFLKTPQPFTVTRFSWAFSGRASAFTDVEGYC